MTDTVVEEVAASAAEAPAVEAPAVAESPKVEAPKAEPAKEAPAVEPKTEAKPEPKWSETWREDMAAGDEKILTLAKRYNTPGAMAKALKDAQALIHSGKYKQPLDPAKATPEELAEYRKTLGVPEKPEDYKVELGDGVVLSDQQKAQIDGFKAHAHALNLPAGTVESVVKWQIEQAKAQAMQRAEMDVEQKSATEEALRAEWGGDYKANISGIKAMLGGADKEIAEAFANARLPDGTALWNHPGVVKLMADQARMLGYVGGTIAPSGDASTMADEIKRIEGMMYDERGFRNDAYWKDDKLQAKYRDLLAARDRIKS